MGIELAEAKHFKPGDFIMINDVPCRVFDNMKSAPGKHGHLKCRIIAQGIFDGRKREEFAPGDGKLGKPSIDKRQAQVLSVDDKTAQLMDIETFENFDAQIPSELSGKVQPGINVEYWVIADTTKAIMEVKSG